MGVSTTHQGVDGRRRVRDLKTHLTTNSDRRESPLEALDMLPGVGPPNRLSLCLSRFQEHLRQFGKGRCYRLLDINPCLVHEVDLEPNYSYYLIN